MLQSADIRQVLVDEALVGGLKNRDLCIQPVGMLWVSLALFERADELLVESQREIERLERGERLPSPFTVQHSTICLPELKGFRSCHDLGRLGVAWV